MVFSKELFVRKTVHLFIGMAILLLTYFLDRNFLLTLIIGGTVFSFTTYNHRRFYQLHKTSNSSLGTLFYPMGVLLSYLVLYDMPKYYFQSAIAVLAISDLLANLIGKIKKGNGWVYLLHDRKSFHGMVGYAASALIIFHVFLPFSLTGQISFVILVLMFALIFEVISWRGSDNLSIPLGLAIFYRIVEIHQFDYVFQIGVLLVMILGAIVLFRWKILTRAGSLTAFVLGYFLLGIAGIQWFVVVLLFFISSVFFTKWRHYLQRNTGKPSSPRNAWQVIANILWAALSVVLYLISPNEIYIYFFITVVAAVTADTWASEVGPMFHKRSFSLSHMTMKKAGTTGGISFAGSLAAALGAVIVSSLSYYIFFGQWHWFLIALFSISAFLACFTDTLLGAFVETKMMRWQWFKNNHNPEALTPNDLVNLAGSLSSGIFLIIFLHFI